MRHALELAVVVLVALGCGDGSSEKGEDPGEHACEALAWGGAAVTATEVREDAPEVVVGPDGYTVTLPTGASGWVRFVSDGSAPMLLFVDTANVASTLYLEDEEEGLPDGSPNDFCPEGIPEHFHLDSTEAGTRYLELGPAAVDSVWLLLMSAEGHEHHDE